MLISDSTMKSDFWHLILLSSRLLFLSILKSYCGFHSRPPVNLPLLSLTLFLAASWRFLFFINYLSAANFLHSRLRVLNSNDFNSLYCYLYGKVKTLFISPIWWLLIILSWFCWMFVLIRKGLLAKSLI